MSMVMMATWLANDDGDDDDDDDHDVDGDEAVEDDGADTMMIMMI